MFHEQPQDLQETISTEKGTFVLVNAESHGESLVKGLYQYQGEDSAIKALCNAKGQVTIQIFTPTSAASLSFMPALSKEEHDIRQQESIRASRHLASKSVADTSPLYAMTMPLTDRDGRALILSQAIIYDDIKSKSIDLQMFTDLIHKKKVKTNPNLATTLDQIAQSMHAGQTALHQTGVLHLNSTPKHFWVNKPGVDAQGHPTFSVTIADYDRAVIGTEREFVNNMPLDPQWMDTTALVYNGVSTSTDLFAMKASIIAMLGFVLGAQDATDVLKLESDRGFIAQRKQAPFNNDTVVLTTYLSHVQQRLEKCPDPAKKEQVQAFISAYRNYLTTMPKSLSADAEDNALFSQATQNLPTTLQSLMIAKISRKEEECRALFTDNKKYRWEWSRENEPTEKEINKDPKIGKIWNLRMDLQDLKQGVLSGQFTTVSVVERDANDIFYELNKALNASPKQDRDEYKQIRDQAKGAAPSQSAGSSNLSARRGHGY